MLLAMLDVLVPAKSKITCAMVPPSLVPLSTLFRCESDFPPNKATNKLCAALNSLIAFSQELRAPLYLLRATSNALLYVAGRLMRDRVRLRFFWTERPLIWSSAVATAALTSAAGILYLWLLV
jgi:hypothetical protein